MQKTLTTDEAIQLLLADDNASWSRDGARAIVEYLEQLEEDTDEPLQFDRVAIRCDFTEYGSALEAATEYTAPMDNEQAALEWLQERTTVIPFDGRTTLPGGQVLGSAGVIVAIF